MEAKIETAVPKKSSLIGIILLKVQRGIMIASSFLVVLIISTATILRYVFKTDLFGFEEIVVIFAFWLYFMGASYGSYEKSHITADIISAYVTSDKLHSTIKFISSLITVALSWLFTYWAVGFFIWGIVKKAKSPVWGIPLVIPQSAVIAGITLMSIYFTSHLIDDLKGLIRAYR